MKQKTLREEVLELYGRGIINITQRQIIIGEIEKRVAEIDEWIEEMKLAGMGLTPYGDGYLKALKKCRELL